MVTQEIEEFRKQLLVNLNILNLCIRKDVQSDGNCLFHCISDQMDRLNMTTISQNIIRSNLADFLRKLPSNDPLKELSTAEYIDQISQNGTWADAVAITGVARMLQRDIHIVTSQKESSERGYIMNKISCDKELVPPQAPFLVGHIGEFHYVSLAERDESIPDQTTNDTHTTSLPQIPETCQTDKTTPKQPDSELPCEDNELHIQDRNIEFQTVTLDSPETRNAANSNDLPDTDQASSTCQCCASPSTASQPSSKIIISNTTREYKSNSGTKTKRRTFQVSWYTKYHWLHLCLVSHRAYCFYCILAHRDSPHVLGSKVDETFFKTGFNNWKKGIERFEEHEHSKAHIGAVELHKSRNQPHIGNLISQQFTDDQGKHRASLLSELSAIKFLTRQGIALRGHTESESNLRQLLSNCMKEEEWTRDGKYLSHDIVNEIIEIMAHDIIRDLLNEAKQSSQFFTILADETRDCANREQLVVCLRWVAEDYTVSEDPLGLFQVSDTKAQTIYTAIKDVMTRCGLQIENCRGQGYDGASNFQGHISGVAKRIQDEVPSAVPVHCLAHCTNLALQDVSRKSHAVRDALDFSLELVQLIKYSPKRQVLFEEMKKDFPGNPGLKPLCPTRWTVRTGSMTSIVENYDPLVETLTEVHSSGNDEYSRKANGLLFQMERFQTYFGLKLSILVFSAVEQLSITLQSKNTNAEDAFSAAMACKRYLERLRSDTEFNKFYEMVKQETTDKTDAPCLPRYRRAPKRVDEGVHAHRFSSVELYFRQQYYEVIDTLSGELVRRFDQPNFKVVRDIESVLIKATNGEEFTITDAMINMYEHDLDFGRLNTQLKMLHDVPDKAKIKRVTKVDTICQLFNDDPVLKRMLGQIDRLLMLYLVIPVTTATAERSFSTLRRLKTYLRSTMTQPRLNHCLLLHVFKDRNDDLDVVKIAKQFAERNDRRRLYFGQF